MRLVVSCATNELTERKAHACRITVDDRVYSVDYRRIFDGDGRMYHVGNADSSRTHRAFGSRNRAAYGYAGAGAHRNRRASYANLHCGADRNAYAAYQYAGADGHAAARADSHACGNTQTDIHTATTVIAHADTHVRTQADEYTDYTECNPATGKRRLASRQRTCAREPNRNAGMGSRWIGSW